MAFVNANPPRLALSSFAANSVSVERPSVFSVWQSRSRVAPRMLIEDGQVASTKGSRWKENVFTGGIPGGEEFYNKWVEDGMQGDFDDLPDYMQPGAAKISYPEKDRGVLGRLDNLDFMAGLTSILPKQEEQEVAVDAVSPGSSAPAASKEEEEVAVSTDPEEPNEALYAPYFPRAIRNIAPEINMVYENNFFKDRVSVAMTPVTSHPSEVYFPKETSGKAPVIDISYNGVLSSASVSVSMEDIQALPGLAPPARAGETTSTLVPGTGGGLKLDFSVDGESVNVYSDPRCVENYNAMLGR